MKRMRGALSVLLLLHIASTLTAQDLQRRYLSIEDMYQLAETNSRSIRTYDIAAQEAGQAVKVAQNAMLPTLDVSLSASYLGDGWIADRDFTDGIHAPMPHFSNNFALEASQVIYAGGAITSAISIARLQQQIATLDKEKNRQEIRFLLVGNYLELYKLRNEAAVYRQNIGQTRRLLADIKAKHTEGLVLRNDITRHELQLQSLELALTQIENSRIILNNQLVTVLGLPQETVVEVDTNLVLSLPQLATETEWQRNALQVSPLLQQANLRMQQPGYEQKMAEAERLPHVALVAGDHLDGPITIEVPPINKNFNYWYVGVGVKYNLASLYTTDKKVKLAKLSTQRAVENRKLQQEQLQTDVKAAYVRFEESFTIYKTQMKSLELAAQNYSVINNRYLNDLALIADMLDASNSKLSAELQVANARVHILFNYYKLRKATGNL